MDIAHRIGVTTHFMPAVNNEDIFKAINKFRNAGFAGFEIVPSKDQGQIGWPKTWYNIGIEPDDLTEKDIERLKEALGQFKFVTIHSPHVGFNLSGTNRYVREISKRIYNSCLELAIKLDVKIVTFHPGFNERPHQRPEKESIQFNIEYGKSILPLARLHGIKIGYEVCDTFEVMREIIDGIGEDFSLNLDIGHALMNENSDSWLEKYCSHFKGRIVEVHMNGVNHYWGQFMEHQPPHLNNAIDYQATFERLKADGFEGPVICEIQGNDLEQVIEHCQEAKEMIVGIWNGTRKLKKRWNVPE